MSIATYLSKSVEKLSAGLKIIVGVLGAKGQANAAASIQTGRKMVAYGMSLLIHQKELLWRLATSQANLQPVRRQHSVLWVAKGCSGMCPKLFRSVAVVLILASDWDDDGSLCSKMEANGTLLLSLSSLDIVSFRLATGNGSKLSHQSCCRGANCLCNENDFLCQSFLFFDAQSDGRTEMKCCQIVVATNFY
jgi:hypothetical protein